MYILSLSLCLSVHNSVNSWRNFFKLSTVVVDKGTAACRGIRSSLNWNWNTCISVIYCRIEVKLVLVKAKFFKRLLFRKKYFLCHFRSTKHGIIKLEIADICLWLYVGLSHKLVREIWIVHIIYISYKISCDLHDLEGHLDLLGQLQGKWIFFLFRLISPFITLSILDQITLIFQRWLLKKELLVA